MNLHDVSALFATVCKLERRRALVITTLYDSGKHPQFLINKMEGTYNPPMAKTPTSAIFCVLGSFSCESRGIGIMSNVRSVAIFIAALKNHSASKLRQLPSIDRFQNFATGTQLTKPLTIAQDEYVATTPMTV